MVKNWKCERFAAYLNRRRKPFVNIFGTIACCNHQIVSTFGFTIQHSFGVNRSIRDNLEMIVVTCGYGVLNATVIACKKRKKKKEKFEQLNDFRHK